MQRRVLVTGANSGIGLATAVHLARLGFEVVGSARDETKARHLVDVAARGGVSVDAVVFDLADEESYRKVVQELDLWAVVNNAGYMNVGLMEDVPIETVRRQFETMVFAPLRLTQLVLRDFQDRGDGRIVNVTSALVHDRGPFIGWYAAAKHALATATEALRAEVVGTGVEVIAIEPGGVRTGIWAKARTELEDRTGGSRNPEAYATAQSIADAVERRMVPPERVAAAIGEVLVAGHPPRVKRVGLGSTAVPLLALLVPDTLRDRISRTALRLRR